MFLLISSTAFASPTNNDDANTEKDTNSTVRNTQNNEDMLDGIIPPAEEIPPTNPLHRNPIEEIKDAGRSAANAVFGAGLGSAAGAATGATVGALLGVVSDTINTAIQTTNTTLAPTTAAIATTAAVPNITSTGVVGSTATVIEMTGATTAATGFTAAASSSPLTTTGAATTGAGAAAATGATAGAIAGAVVGGATGFTTGMIFFNDDTRITSHRALILGASSGANLAAKVTLGGAFGPAAGYVGGFVAGFATKKIAEKILGVNEQSLIAETTNNPRSCTREALSACLVGGAAGALTGALAGVSAAGIASSASLIQGITPTDGLLAGAISGLTSGVTAAHGNKQESLLDKAKKGAVAGAVSGASAPISDKESNPSKWGAKVIATVIGSANLAAAAATAVLREVYIKKFNRKTNRYDINDLEAGVHPERSEAIARLENSDINDENGDPKNTENAQSQQNPTVTLIRYTRKPSCVSIIYPSHGATQDSYFLENEEETERQNEENSSNSSRQPFGPLSGSSVTLFIDDEDSDEQNNQSKDYDPNGPGGPFDPNAVAIAIHYYEEGEPPNNNESIPSHLLNANHREDEEEFSNEKNDENIIKEKRHKSPKPFNINTQQWIHGYNYEGNLSSLQALQHTNKEASSQIKNHMLTLTLQMYTNKPNLNIGQDKNIHTTETYKHVQTKKHNLIESFQKQEKALLEHTETLHNSSVFASTNIIRSSTPHSTTSYSAQCGIITNLISKLTTGISYSYQKSSTNTLYGNYINTHVGRVKTQTKSHIFSTIFGWNTDNPGITGYILGARGCGKIKNTRYFPHNNQHIHAKGRSSTTLTGIAAQLGYAIQLNEKLNIKPYAEIIINAIKQKNYIETSSKLPAFISTNKTKYLEKNAGISSHYDITTRYSLQTWIAYITGKETSKHMSLRPCIATNEQYTVYVPNQKNTYIKEEIGLDLKIYLTTTLGIGIYGSIRTEHMKTFEMQNVGLRLWYNF